MLKIYGEVADALQAAARQAKVSRQPTAVFADERGVRVHDPAVVDAGLLVAMFDGQGRLLLDDE